jgi:hypothetical protein
MCYFLYIASPLTLTEVRSMLPRGLTADLASSSEQQSLKAIHPTAQTVARILVGRCSCDIVRQRLPDGNEDERHLRQRYRDLGLTRPATILALERHRQGSRSSRPPADPWPIALSRFVAEHARNAGSTLFLLQFEAEPTGVRSTSLSSPARCSLEEVRLNPDRWLQEGTPVIV